MLSALSALVEGNCDEWCRCRQVQSMPERTFNTCMMEPDNVMNGKWVENNDVLKWKHS